MGRDIITRYFVIDMHGGQHEILYALPLNNVPLSVGNEVYLYTQNDGVYSGKVSRVVSVIKDISNCESIYVYVYLEHETCND